MSMRMYEVTVGRAGGPTRILQVPSKTDVQAGDAAIALMTEGESLISIKETDAPFYESDGPPAGTQTHPDRTV